MSLPCVLAPVSGPHEMSALSCRDRVAAGALLCDSPETVSSHVSYEGDWLRKKNQINRENLMIQVHCPLNTFQKN